MRNAILFIIFLIFSFFINVVFYYISDDYRLFLKNIKNDSNISKIDDSFLSIKNNFSDTQDSTSITNDSIIIDEIEIDDSIELVKINNENDNIFDKNTNKVEIKNSVNLGKNYLDILNNFSNYNFQELELNTNLFDITDEYPDNYLEYYSRDLTLYFFPTKSYKEVYDLFSVLEFELPFKINQTNSFGDNSFFINLNQDIVDNYIRVVVNHKGVAFGLKIKKNEYNSIKEKLNNLRNN
ncbi:hypothetical protein HUU51_02860 [Candidatus Gracilibacteria bacterium]|nr:hypothetical protein [Candidatus Gracilibacteria bacterium]